MCNHNELSPAWCGLGQSIGYSEAEVIGWLTCKGIAAGERGLSILVAAGPFTSKDDVLYEPLQAVLDYCSERPPHVLLLLGPFVDAEHPLVQAGTLQDSFDDTFATQVHDLLHTCVQAQQMCARSFWKCA